MAIPRLLEPWVKSDSREDFPVGLLCHQQDVACFQEAAPGMKDAGSEAKGRPGDFYFLLQPTLAGPGSSGPQFPHLYNGQVGGGPVIPELEDSHWP